VSRTLVIMRRELRSAAVSPVMWVTVALAWFFCAAAAYAFALPQSGGEISIFVFGAASWWLIVQILIVPMLSMRLLSEEKRAGTFEALMTAPVDDHEVVLGKFLAANVVHAIAALILPLMMIPFLIYGRTPDWGQVAGAFLTAVGIGALFLAIGIFASSLTSAQILAGFLTVLIEGALLFGPSLALQHLPADHVIVQGLRRGHLFTHVQEGSLGILDLNNATYQVVMAALFLLFAVRSLEIRKWK
jgi:ABC-2 type transport system permease protein